MAVAELWGFLHPSQFRGGPAVLGGVHGVRSDPDLSRGSPCGVLRGGNAQSDSQILLSQVWWVKAVVNAAMYNVHVLINLLDIFDYEIKSGVFLVAKLYIQLHLDIIIITFMYLQTSYSFSFCVFLFLVQIQITLTEFNTYID